MRKIWMPSIVAAITLAAAIAAAQTPPPPAPGGAFESLSPGNQKIALAIFDSEQLAASTTSTKSGSTATTTPLSLDQIAEMKQSGKGWGVIFKEMKSQGLVQDRNLGQAVSRLSRSGGGASATPTQITTASGKTVIVGGHEGSDVAVSSGRRGSGSDDAQGNAVTPTATNHGRDAGASAAGSSAGSHGGGHGK